MTADAPAEGYPVTIRLPRFTDGPLVITERDGSTLTFEVARGRASATTRARADRLLALGGRLEAPPTDTPPAGSGPTLRKSRGNT